MADKNKFKTFPSQYNSSTPFALDPNFELKSSMMLKGGYMSNVDGLIRNLGY